MELHETQTALLCTDRFNDQHHTLDRPPWKSIHYNEEAPKKSSATGAGDLVIMPKIVPQDRDLVSGLA